MELDKNKARIDEAMASMAELKEAVQTLETESADYEKASKDYRDSADAVGKAIGVLRSYYEGALLQTNVRTVVRHRSILKRSPHGDAMEELLDSGDVTVPHPWDE